MTGSEASQTNNMSQKRAADDEHSAPSSKFPRNAVAANAGPLGGAPGLAVPRASSSGGECPQQTISTTALPSSAGGAGGAAGSSGVFVFVHIHTYIHTYPKRKREIVRTDMNLPIYLFIITNISLSPGSGGGPPPRPRASSANLRAAHEALRRSRASIAPPGAFLDAINKGRDAALAANTFTKQAVEVDNFRCFIQVYDHGRYTLEEYPWEEILAPSYKVNVNGSSGLFIFPSVDHLATLYKMVPFGNAEPTIRDYDSCGVSDMSAGSSLEWHFDREVNYVCNNEHVSFIVVKIPGTRPPTLWDSRPAAVPETLTSLDVEKIVRAKFFIAHDEKLEEPCWIKDPIVERELSTWRMSALAGDVQYKALYKNHSDLQGAHLKQAIEMEEMQVKYDELAKKHLELQKKFSDIKPESIVENERDMWKRAFVKMKRKHETLFDKYKDLMGDYTKLSDKDCALLEENIRVERDSQLTSTALHDIKESMMCAICLDSGYDVEPAVVSSCGHVLHEKCYESQKPAMGDTCCKCMQKNILAQSSSCRRLGMLSDRMCVLLCFALAYISLVCP